MKEVVEVLTFGDAKYNPDNSNPENWKHVPNWDTRYFAATMRHMLAWMEGDVLDNETGCNHLAHAACCILFMLSKDMEHDYGADSEPAATLNHYQAQLIGASIELALANVKQEQLVAEILNHDTNDESTAA